MVGSKMEEMAGSRIAGTDSGRFLAGCGTPQEEQGKMKVGIVQIVQHPALDEANRGFVAALDERGTQR